MPIDNEQSVKVPEVAGFVNRQSGVVYVSDDGDCVSDRCDRYVGGNVVINLTSAAKAEACDEICKMLLGLVSDSVAMQSISLRSVAGMIETRRHNRKYKTIAEQIAEQKDAELLERSQQDILAGRVHDHEDVKKELL